MSICYNLLSAVFLCLTVCFGAGSNAYALKTAVVYGLGFKLDKSFNESAFLGVINLRKSNSDISEYSLRTEEQRIPTLEKAASTAEHVITIGYPLAKSLVSVAPKYRHTKFTTIDAITLAPNVQSVTFREQEGAFLAGIAAAMASKSKIIGFVGGMDSDAVKRFQAGYEQGAKYIDPHIKIISRYIGTNTYAFNTPMKGYLIARKELQEGVDVVFAAAGSSGLGVYEAADEAAAYAIGVDSNQNHLFPTTMLTSVVKEVGLTLEHIAQAADVGRWSNQPKSFGLKEGAFSLAEDKYNADIFPEEIKQAVHKASVKIITGEIKISPNPDKPAYIKPSSMD